MLLFESNEVGKLLFCTGVGWVWVLDVDDLVEFGEKAASSVWVRIISKSASLSS